METGFIRRGLGHELCWSRLFSFAAAAAFPFSRDDDCEAGVTKNKRAEEKRTVTQKEEKEKATGRPLMEGAKRHTGQREGERTGSSRPSGQWISVSVSVCV